MICILNLNKCLLSGSVWELEKNLQSWGRMRGKPNVRVRDTVRTAGWLKGKPTPFTGHFYSLKTENSYWKGDIRWLARMLEGGNFTYYGVREPAGLDTKAHGNSCYGAWSLPEIFVLWPWHVAVHGVTENRMWLSNWTELNWLWYRAPYIYDRKCKWYKSIWWKGSLLLTAVLKPSYSLSS